MNVGTEPRIGLRYGPVNAPQKDANKNALRASICSGAQTFAAAQTAFLAKWVR